MTKALLLTLSFNNAPLNNPLSNQISTSFYAGIIYDVYLKYLPHNSFNLNNLKAIMVLNDYNSLAIEPRNLKSVLFHRISRSCATYN